MRFTEIVRESLLRLRSRPLHVSVIFAFMLVLGATSVSVDAASVHQILGDEELRTAAGQYVIVAAPTGEANSFTVGECLNLGASPSTLTVAAATTAQPAKLKNLGGTSVVAMEGTSGLLSIWSADQRSIDLEAEHTIGLVGPELGQRLSLANGSSLHLEFQNGRSIEHLQGLEVGEINRNDVAEGWLVLIGELDATRRADECWIEANPGYRHLAQATAQYRLAHQGEPPLVRPLLTDSDAQADFAARLRDRLSRYSPVVASGVWIIFSLTLASLTAKETAVYRSSGGRRLDLILVRMVYLTVILSVVLILLSLGSTLLVNQFLSGSVPHSVANTGLGGLGVFSVAVVLSPALEEAVNRRSLIEVLRE